MNPHVVHYIFLCDCVLFACRHVCLCMPLVGIIPSYASQNGLCYSLPSDYRPGSSDFFPLSRVGLI